jgi:hypothetical protein
MRKMGKIQKYKGGGELSAKYATICIHGIITIKDPYINNVKTFEK